jgi:Domain of unknown function (DUF4157)
VEGPLTWHNEGVHDRRARPGGAAPATEDAPAAAGADWRMRIAMQRRAAERKLDPSLKQRVESETGGDLSEVRLHTGERSAAQAKELSARAFTVGKDVHFGAGQFQPGTRDGDRLIAHELAHAAHGGAEVRCKPENEPEQQDGHEQQADEVAEKAAGGDEPVAKLTLNADVETADRTKITWQELQNASVGHAWISLEYNDPKKVPQDLGQPTQGLLRGGGTHMGFWPLIHRVDEWPGGKANEAIQERTDEGQTPGAGASENPAHTGFSKNPFNSYVPGRVEEPDTAHAPKGVKTYDLTGQQVKSLMGYVDSKRTAQYSLFFFNCTTFAVDAVAAAGHAPPDASMFGVCLPNALYKSILEMEQKGDPGAQTTPLAEGESQPAPQAAKKAG